MQLEHSTASQILALLKRRPRGMTISDLARQANLHRNTVATQLEIMHIAGQVELRTIGSAKVYSCAQRVPLSAFLCFTRNLILVLGANLQIVQANDQFLKLTNSTKTDLIGKTLEDLSLPIVSTPEAQAVIHGLGKEQIITDIRYEHAGTESFYQMEVIPTTFEDGEKGATIVLEDITERKRYIRNMEFLAKTAMELVDLPREADIFGYIADRIVELVPEARAFIESYDEVSRRFFVRAMVDKDFREGVIGLLGQDAVGMAFPVDNLFAAPFNETVASVFRTREHIFRPESEATGWSLYQILFGVIPEEVCEAILDRFTIGRLYGVGLAWEDQLFGIVGIFLSPGESLHDREVIESFLRQASIAIARRQTEERLSRSEARFREVLNLASTPTAIIDGDGRYTFVNQRFADLFGYTLPDIPTGREWFARAFPDPAEKKAAIAAWKADLEPVRTGQVRPRTFVVQCKDGERKTILFRPVTLADGNQYVTYEEAAI